MLPRRSFGGLDSIAMSLPTPGFSALKPEFDKRNRLPDRRSGAVKSNEESPRDGIPLIDQISIQSDAKLNPRQKRVDG